jgi:hypothetical protein
MPTLSLPDAVVRTVLSPRADPSIEVKKRGAETRLRPVADLEMRGYSSDTLCISKNICVGLRTNPLTSLRVTRTCKV